MIVIIGNGISGVTTARYIRKRSDEPILIISAESKYFFSRTALMYVYMGHMKFEHTQPYEPHFWEKNRIELKQARVNSVDTNAKQLKLDNGETISYTSLVLAAGSKPNKFGWKGQDLKRVGGLYSKQDLEYVEECSDTLKRAVIVGGGLIGIELAEMFLSRNIEVHFLVREGLFWGGVLPKRDSQMIMRHMDKHHGLHMHYNEELAEIVDNGQGEACAVITKTGERIDCQFVGLTAGVSPNIDFLSESGIETERGIMVNRFLETNIEDVYAIGDCAQFKEPLPNRRPIEQVWYTGKFMGETVAKTITGERTEYNPGHWFNSAKFFDVEYQTYGMVYNKLQEGESEFIFEDEKNEVLLHFVFDTDSHKFIGVNNFGIRLRHQLFNEWLLQGATIEDVLKDLKSANFDPEFYKHYEDAVIAQFNKEFNSSITARKAKWWQTLVTK
ncbi:MAG: FAD-dependent oxidoreductase [Crocinitomicaceae bacterium]